MTASEGLTFLKPLGQKINTTNPLFRTPKL